MNDILKRYYDTIPKSLRPEFNPVLNAFILALATADYDNATQAKIAKDQLFLMTSSGKFLDQNASAVGVSRPGILGLSDEKFRELVPNLSLKPKQIKKAFYDTADVFWGPLFSRANVSTQNVGPFNLIPGDIIQLKVDNGPLQTVKIRPDEIALSGSATEDEVLAILSRFDNITAQIVPNIALNGNSINIRTNTPGSVGVLEIVGGSGIGPTKLDFEIKEHDILDISDRVSIYNINPNELIIELPITLPALSRTINTAHYFHANPTIEPVGPDGVQWKGNFFFAPTGIAGNFTISGNSAVLDQTIVAGQVYQNIAMVDVSNIPNAPGYLIFNFGYKNQEVPVRYLGTNLVNNTIQLDAAYIFTETHSPGSVLHEVIALQAYEPSDTLEDHAIYMTSSTEARAIAQDTLSILRAAGIIVKFEVKLPTYSYLIDNPYEIL